MSLLQKEMVERENAQSGKYLEFLIGKEAYVIDICYVTEIISMQPVNALPEVPEYLKGVINLRGRIIPVIDMHLRLHKKEAAYSDRTCIVVFDDQRLSAGLVVDRVSDVLKIDEKDITPPLELNTPGANNLLSGIAKVGDDVKLLLNCKELLSCSDADAIKDAINGGLEL